MANWIELGEVPDSEQEEDDFENLPAEKPSTQSQPKNLPPTDIWDVPDSQNPDPEGNRILARPGQPALPLPPLAHDPTTSSPLSSPLSDGHLPPLDQFVYSYGLIRTPIPSPDALPHHGLEAETHAAGPLPVRYERSLRPRKPIQEHPYLLENAHYSSCLKKHGLRPLRLPRPTDHAKRMDISNDDDFEDDSQETAHWSTTDDGLPIPVENAILADPPIPTLPPLPSLFRENSPPSNLAGSQSETDDTSVLGEDLPALKDLLNQVPPRPSRRPAKRWATPPLSAPRKRARFSNPNGDTYDTDTTSTKISDSPDILAATPRQPQHLPTPHPISTPRLSAASPTPPFAPAVQVDSAAPTAATTTTTAPAPLNTVIDVSSDEDRVQAQPDSPSRTRLFLGSESELESDSQDLVNRIGRRIRGVLPASWLRLDQQSGRDKAQMKVRKRQRVGASGRDKRRGVAITRPAFDPPPVMPFLFDDSDDAKTPTQVGPISGSSRHTTVTVPEADIVDAAPEHDIQSGSDSMLEEDFVDAMFPTKPTIKRRQINSDIVNTQRQGTDATAPNPKIRNRKVQVQQKITNFLDELERAEMPDRGENQRPPPPSRTSRYRAQDFGGKHRKKATTNGANPPLLGVLDSIEPGAPRFLKIAARTARKKRRRGRCSPRRKIIQLATRDDHLDAASVLRAWKSGLIPQRPLTNASGRSAPKGQMPLAEASANRSRISPGSRGQPMNTVRRFVKQLSHGGSVSYRGANECTSGLAAEPKPPTARRIVSKASRALSRPALLETEEGDQAMSSLFRSRKTVLDSLYRNRTLKMPPTRISSLASIHETAPAWDGINFHPGLQKPAADTALPTPGMPSSKSRYRKASKPRRVDIEAPHYSHANDPVPVRYTPESDQPAAARTGTKLLGLGPYGTAYTHHFEIFPLGAGIYFHESTLIGSGLIESCSRSTCREALFDARHRVSFDIGNKILRWGEWDAQVSSEMGIVLDVVADGLDALVDAKPEACNPLTAVRAATFIMKYVMDSVSFAAEADIRPFLTRAHECLHLLNERVSVRVLQLAQYSDRRTILLQVYDRLLVAGMALLKICRLEIDSAPLQVQMEELLKWTGKIAATALAEMGLKHVRKTLEDIKPLRARERGIRDDSAAMHSWVVLMKVFEMANVPRASFWDLAQEVIVTPKLLASLDARDYEAAWEDVFTLLPLSEFNNLGVIICGQRHSTTFDGWAAPQQLLKKVLGLYQQNPRQSPSFNNYCRALIARCHYLVQQWGWRKCAAVVGILFDFFGSQDLSHLRNEEVYSSPRFLEELAGRPRLQVEVEDKCFHVFLKLVAVGIWKLREVGSTKDIRNLVARTMPNHNRQYHKEQNVRARDLAALRNHHDLLCTLFWAAPPELRPAANLMERLVVPADSHKEACLINIRCWSQLGRLIVASGEASTAFRPFILWRNRFVEQLMHELESVAADVKQQLSALTKDVSQLISEDMIRAAISMNKASIMDVLYASCAASMDVTKQSADLEAATFSLNRLQLQTVFSHFSMARPELDLGILKVCLRTLDFYLDLIGGYKESEASQQSESLILNSSATDDALLVVDHDIAESFFSMARCLLASTRRGVADDCLSQVIRLAAKLGAKLSGVGLMRPSDMFKKGKFCLLKGSLHELGLDQRRYLVLLVAELLEQGVDEIGDSGFSLLELWAQSLVKPVEFIEFEDRLGAQLVNNSKLFVPEAIKGLKRRLDYDTNRELFEFVVSYMRRSVREAEPSMRRRVVAEHSKSLKLVMEQLRQDLRTMSDRPRGHAEYVSFVQEIVALIKAHGSELCAIDSFFYQTSREYCPSLEDPQLQVAGLISYGVRLDEGDNKSGQELFFLLFNNAQFSIARDRLGPEVEMLQKGMEHRGVSHFILGKFLPAVVRASFQANCGLPLMDMYAKALGLVLAGRTAARELGEEELPDLLVLLDAAIEVLRSGRGRGAALMSPSSAPRAHLTRQLLGVLNLLWPSLHSMWAAGMGKGEREGSDAWAGVMERLETVADILMSGATTWPEEADQPAYPPRRSEGDLKGGGGERHFGADVDLFTETMVQEMKRGWRMDGERIWVELADTRRGRGGDGRKGGISAEGRGVVIPAWDLGQMQDDVRERVRDWDWGWQWMGGGRGGDGGEGLREAEVKENLIF